MNTYVKLALQSIRFRLLRSVLTVLAIGIGIAAIVALVSMSQGLENAISEQFEGLGSNKVYIFPKSAGSFINVQDTALTIKDVDILERLPESDYVNSYLFEKDEVRFANEGLFTGVTGFESEEDPQTVFEGQGLKLDEGRWFNSRETGSVIVGSKIAEEGYKKEIRIGNKLEVQEKKYTVIGILEPLGNEEDDNNLWFAMEDAREILDEPEQLNLIEIVVVDGIDTAEFSLKVERDLERARGEEDFEVLIPEQILGQLSNILVVLQVVLVGIAGISIVVGAVGIMNSMFTNVLERRKEIGILKAVGATPTEIKKIFMVEAGILGALGGFFGSVVGTTISLGVGAVAKAQGFVLLKITVEPGVILFGIVFATVVGVVSGYLPARDASKLLPVEALRK